MASGMELARKYRLPAQVRAFISEHHGTRLVTYFYRKASQQKPDVDSRLVAYAGPKPRSKETAIAMLADSAESVVRSSRDRSPERIDALVGAVIQERLVERWPGRCSDGSGGSAPAAKHLRKRPTAWGWRFSYPLFNMASNSR